MNAQTPGGNYLGNVEGIILDALKAAKGSTRDTFDRMLEIGSTLDDAKAFFKDNKEAGDFAKWALDTFGFAKAWTARLIQLHNAKADIALAMEWAAGQGRDTTKLYTVDGALKLVKEWKVATDDEARAKAEEKAAKAESAKAERESAKRETETEAERLRRYIAELERENAKLKEALNAANGGTSSGPKADAKPGAGKVDAATKARAGKVWGLYTRGATDGEKAAAKSRLDDMAAKAGMTFDAFVAACGLSK